MICDSNVVAMNDRFVNNNRRGQNPGKGNTPTVYYTDQTTDVVIYVGMAELSYRGLLEICGGIRHECRGSNSKY